MDPSRFYAVVSGRDRSPTATLARGVLRLAEFPYAAAMRWRNHRFDSSPASVRRVPVPVLSIGNLSLGGTGKTPLVAWLAEHLTERGIRVAILSRGYGGDPQQGNDEGLELQQRIPQVPHLQHPNRVRSAEIATREHSSQLLLLDDGFQHRRLYRDLDIVLLDSHSPFGYGHVFPRGTLREPLTGLSRADIVCLTRSDQLETAARQAVRQQVAATAPRALWCELAHAPRQLVNTAGESRSCQSLRSQRIVAFCGIGNPESFRQTVHSNCEYQLLDLREYPDHHAYSAADLTALGSWAAEQGAAAVVCTHKDLVKVGQTQLGRLPLWALQVEMQFLHGKSSLLSRIDAVLAAYGLPTLPTGEDGRFPGPGPSTRCA